MGLITITNFALKHKVSRQSIHAAIKRKEIKVKKVAGLKFIESTHKYVHRAANKNKTLKHK